MQCVGCEEKSTNYGPGTSTCAGWSNGEQLGSKCDPDQSDRKLSQVDLSVRKSDPGQTEWQVYIT